MKLTKQKLIKLLLVVITFLSLTLVAACNSENIKIEFYVDDVVYQSVTYNEETGIELPADPTKTGYVFSGWSLDGENVDASITEGKVIDSFIVDENNTLSFYCVWKIEVYSITYILNGGVNAAQNPSTYTILDDEITLQDPTNEDIEFNGWLEGNTIVSGSVGNKVFTASWSTDCKVTFSDEVESQVVEYNGVATLPEEPTKEGYTFVYWMDSEGKEYDFDTLVIEDLYLEAKWEIKEYKVTFSDEAETQVVEYNGVATLPEEPTKEGYTFVYWMDSEGKEYDFDTLVIEDLYLEAKWEANEYTVIYDANSGSGSNVTQVFTYDTLNQSLEANTFTKTGYSFVGWSTSATGDVVYEDKDIITTNLSTGSNVYLYAVWTAKTYNVIFVNNDAYQEQYKEDITQVHTYDTSLNLSVLTFTQTGYTFAGWNTSADGSGVSYSDEASVRNLSTGEDIYLYSTWQANTYTIIFDSNFPTEVDNDGSMENQLFTYDIKLTLSENVYTKVGYTFLGWSTSATGDVVYEDKAEIHNITTINNDKITLYAVWEPNEYTVIYNGNSSTSGSMENQIFTYDIEGNLLENVYTRDGYTFVEWNTSIDGSGVSYSDEEEVLNLSTSEDFTLYAVWEANEYTVIYNANGGIGTIENSEFTYDQEEILSANSYAKLGYTFAGWNTSEDGSGVSYSNEANVRNLSTGEDIYLYSTWQANTYTIIFDSNFPTEVDNDGSMENQLFTYDIKLTLSENVYTKVGYTFLGWSTSATGDVVYEDKAEIHNITTINNDKITLYAVWEPNEYTVIYNGNSSTNGSMENQTFTYDIEGNLLENVYTKEGYTFVEWNTSIDGSGMSYSDEEEVLNLSTSEDFTLYAVWEANEYTVIYNANGGTGTIENSEFTYDQEEILSANSYTKLGYTFAGWNTSIDGSGVSYSDEEEVLNLSTKDDFVLYAVWDLDIYTISYELNDGTNSTYNVDSYTIESGFKLYNPLYVSYMFMGWYSDSEYSLEFNGFNQTTGNLVLYAMWQEEVATEGLEFGLNNDGTYSVVGYVGDSTDVVIPYFYDGYEVTSIGMWSFTNSNIESIYIPSSVCTIGAYAFESCLALESVYIPSSVTTIESGAFILCASLKMFEVAIESEDFYAVDGVLYQKLIDGSSALVYYPVSLYAETFVIPDNVSIIYEYSFAFANVKHIVFGENVKTICSCSFFYMMNLESITFNENLESIETFAIYLNMNLQNIYFNNCSVEIASYSFMELENLKYVDLGDNVEYISTEAFCFCPSLIQIKIGSTKLELETTIFSSINENCVIYFTNITSPLSLYWDNDWNRDFLTYSYISVVYKDEEMITYTFVTDGSEVLNIISGSVEETPLTIKENSYFAGWYDNEELEGEAVTFPYMSNVNTTLYAKFTDYFIEDGSSIYSAYTLNLDESQSSTVYLDGSLFYLFTPSVSGYYEVSLYANYKYDLMYSIYTNYSVTKTIIYQYSTIFDQCGVCYFDSENVYHIEVGMSDQVYCYYTDFSICIVGQRTYDFVVDGDVLYSIDAYTLTAGIEIYKEGYYFFGWYDNEELEGEAVTFPYYSSTNTTLYARYEKEASIGSSFDKAIEIIVGETYIDSLYINESIYYSYTPEETDYYSFNLIFGFNINLEILDKDENELNYDNGYYLEADEIYYFVFSIGYSVLFDSSFEFILLRLNEYTFKDDDNILYTIEDYLISEEVQTNKEGYYFFGWYDNEELEGEAVTFPYYSNEYTTLYARFETYKKEEDGESFYTAISTSLDEAVTTFVFAKTTSVYFEFTPEVANSYMILVESDYAYRIYIYDENFNGVYSSEKYLDANQTYIFKIEFENEYARGDLSVVIVSTEEYFLNYDGTTILYKEGYMIDETPIVFIEDMYLIGWYDNEELEGEAVTFPYYSSTKTTLYAKFADAKEVEDGSYFNTAICVDEFEQYTYLYDDNSICYYEFVVDTKGTYYINFITDKSMIIYLYDSNLNVQTYGYNILECTLDVGTYFFTAQLSDPYQESYIVCEVITKQTYKFIVDDEYTIEVDSNIIEESPFVILDDGYYLVGWYDNESFEGDAITFPYYSRNSTLYAKISSEKLEDGVNVYSSCTILLEEDYDTYLLAYDSSIYFEFIVENDGYYKIDFNVYSIQITIYNEDGSIYDSYDSSLYTGEYEFIAGSKYYIKVNNGQYNKTIEFGIRVITKQTYEFYDEDTLIYTYTDSYYISQPSYVLKDGLYFCGWYIDEDCTIKAVFPYYSAEYTILYAKYSNEEQPEDGLNFYTALTIDVGYSDRVYIDEYSKYYFEFTPTETLFYELLCDASNVVEVVIYNDKYEEYSYGSFCRLEAGVTYFYVIEFWSGELCGNVFVELSVSLFG